MASMQSQLKRRVVDARLSFGASASNVRECLETTHYELDDLAICACCSRSTHSHSPDSSERVSEQRGAVKLELQRRMADSRSCRDRSLSRVSMSLTQYSELMRSGALLRVESRHGLHCRSQRLWIATRTRDVSRSVEDARLHWYTPNLLWRLKLQRDSTLRTGVQHTPLMHVVLKLSRDAA